VTSRGRFSSTASASRSDIVCFSRLGPANTAKPAPRCASTHLAIENSGRSKLCLNTENTAMPERWSMA
jgi:hypothetical protein